MCVIYCKYFFGCYSSYTQHTIYHFHILYNIKVNGKMQLKRVRVNFEFSNSKRIALNEHYCSVFCSPSIQFHSYISFSFLSHLHVLIFRRSLYAFKITLMLLLHQFKQGSQCYWIWQWFFCSSFLFIFFSVSTNDQHL